MALQMTSVTQLILLMCLLASIADLYSSVPYECAEMTVIRCDVNAAVTSFTNDCVVHDVAEAVNSL